MIRFPGLHGTNSIIADTGMHDKTTAKYPFVKPDPSGSGKWTKKLLDMTKKMRKRDLSLYLESKRTRNDHPCPMELAEVEEIKKAFGTTGFAGRIYFQAVDHFIRSKVEPFQAVLNTWMQGAKARVNARDVPFTELITWCQENGDNQARSILAKEARSICAFLIPFNYASWKTLLNVLKDDLGYPGYIAFCEEKKNASLAEASLYARAFLSETRETYRDLVEPWLNSVTGLSLKDSSRFDAVYLLGLRYLDHLFPQRLALEKIINFFQKWKMDLVGNPALHIHSEGIPGGQSYCISIDIPGEVHVIVSPLKGWLDMESLFHELGHALSFIYTDPALTTEEKDFFQSNALSETFAFLFQKMCMSGGFLEEILGLSPKNAQIVSRAHALKWLILTRRYATKLAIEVENFRLGYLKNGQGLYSEMMEKETGFNYDPQTYLFDLMPDFYSLDYYQAFMGAACLRDYLNDALGEDWILNPETGNILCHWWHKGNRLDLSSFLQEFLDRPLQSGPFIKLNKHDLGT
ncbi:MAG: hypothetical protein ACQES8_07400 [Thermodesulfobacteriota bacterium]